MSIRECVWRLIVGTAGTACALPFGACAPAAFELVVDATPPGDWSTAEARILTNVRQLTTAEMGLVKSGEAYFSPDMRRIIFQAYPRGQTEYQMFD